MTNLKNKIVFITGASSGIGRSSAIKFAELGANLLICARRKERLEEVSKEIALRYKTNVHSFQMDVRDHQEVERSLNGIPAEWKNISVLLNNAGLSSGFDTIQEGAIEDWEAMIDTNVKGLLYVTRAVLPGMIERKEGHIINLGSVAGRMVYPKGNVYNASKFAVRALNEGMKMDLLGTPVRVTTVDPGLVETEFSVVRFHGDKERASIVYKGITPLTPDDIADAIVWAATRPAHVNINEIVMMPVDQASPMMVNRKSN
ncbi:MAG: SDR family oxidoreductase [Ignavibacteriales bacterium]|nr:SDR family oxidoreductase [Ignavibacteriales bacterium]